jgi:superfamily II DNA or RNA helicase
MQFSPSSIVRARGARWVVLDVREYDACRLVTLSGLAPPHLGVERRLLEPFDDIASVDDSTTPRFVSASRWRAACRALIAADTPPGSLRHGRLARIDFMAHQLEPAIAILAGRGTRVLLADEVGLGKTIQAGLILAELLGRAFIERVLVLTPAGLRDQWMHELSSRFGLDATCVDGRVLRRLATTLPIGTNPWSALAIAVVSTDYAKRPEVLPALLSCRWDAIVVDEVHGAVGDSDRRAAVQSLASRASYVVLLTATPHSGDRTAFASLCSLGAVRNDTLLVFRRRRADVRLNSRRRVHTMRIRLSPAERAMHADLERYVDAVRTERGSGIDLALSVLHKRAFSSPWSLLQSVARRLTSLEEKQPETDARQIALPLDDPDGELTAADQAPEWPSDLALADRSRDRRLLAALLVSSRAAAGAERKIAALRRLLRRAREPAIVFTEYRDTLLHVCQTIQDVATVVVLHGGMTREERLMALATFEQDDRVVLLATDAAGEGLNLQRRCRLVVNLELPWNPMRLEQRIGRVDRIGQSRAVHAFHLVANRTGELHILDRLHHRVALARGDIGAADPLGGLEESPPAQDAMWAGTLVSPDGRKEARTEVERLQWARAVGSNAVNIASGRRPLVISATRARLRAALGTKALLIWRLGWENAAGAAVESTLVAVTIAGVPKPGSRAGVRSTVRKLAAVVGPAIESYASSWREQSLEAVRAVAGTRLAREREILAGMAAEPRDRFQPGLFDRRAERRHDSRRAQAADAKREVANRIALVERASTISSGPPVLLLVALP